MKHIIVITTGGTIAMKYDSVTKGLVPAVSGSDLIEAVPALADHASITVKEFSNMPSGHMTPQKMLELAHFIDELAEAPANDGFVITHGTDTLEETAYLLELSLKTSKPVCITGAMRGASQTSPDGPGNILAAVRTAACDKAIGLGVLVVLNDEIHAAAEVTKTHTCSTRTFASPYWGPLGFVYFNHVCIKRKPIYTTKIPVNKITKNIGLLKCFAGMDEYLFQALIQRPVDGIVIESFGSGNVPPAVKAGIEQAAAAGIPVVITSRVIGGKVVPLYSYEGSTQSMKSTGLLIGEDMSGQKARLRMLLALSRSDNKTDLKNYFTEI